jgi:hypothetical protein
MGSRYAAAGAWQSLMEKPLPGRLELRLSNGSGGSRPPSARGLRQVLNIILLMPGVFLSLMAQGFYPPLDKRLVMGCMIGLFLLPLGLQALGALLKRPGADSAFWPMLYRGSSAALVMLSLLLFLNGGLDRSPWNPVHATVLRKISYSGRRSQSHALIVSSWRPGRSEEDLGATPSVVKRARIGQTVTVPLRQGFFGLAWYGPISLE